VGQERWVLGDSDLVGAVGLEPRTLNDDNGGELLATAMWTILLEDHVDTSVGMDCQWIEFQVDLQDLRLCWGKFSCLLDPDGIVQRRKRDDTLQKF